MQDRQDLHVCNFVYSHSNLNSCVRAEFWSGKYSLGWFAHCAQLCDHCRAKISCLPSNELLGLRAALLLGQLTRWATGSLGATLETSWHEETRSFST